MEQENQELEAQIEELETQIDTSNDEIETSNLTEEDYFKEVARREKAEKALVELKKQLKNTKPLEKNTTNGDIDVKTLIKEQLEEERFFSKNEDAVLYKDKIIEYKAKGLSYDDAYLLATRKDREIDNNKVYSQGNISGKSGNGEDIKLLTIKEFDKLTQDQKNLYFENTKSKLGTVKFKF